VTITAASIGSNGELAFRRLSGPPRIRASADAAALAEAVRLDGGRETRLLRFLKDQRHEKGALLRVEAIDLVEEMPVPGRCRYRRCR